MKRKEVQMKLVSARIPEALAHRLKVEAAVRKVKQQDLIAAALVEYLRAGKEAKRGDQ